jgi:molybdopterin-dependent oxidoreductase alpha subunit
MISLGGNLAVAMSDPDATFEAMRKLDLAVHIATKLNRSHLLLAKQSFILPCLGRTEIDIQASGPQSVTVEDSMSMVHASRGGLKPASEHLKSEPAIVAGLALATLPNTRVKWNELVADYGKIRDAIEGVFPAFKDFNARVAKPGGFRLYVAASERQWLTPSKKANFLVAPGLNEDPVAADDAALTLTTIRSHDQYNTTMYGLNDRYRGITGRRDVLFANEDDLRGRGLKHGDLVDLVALAPAGSYGPERVMHKLTAVAYNISKGSVAAYYPEANMMIALDRYDEQSGTPAYKSTPVTLRAAIA